MKRVFSALEDSRYFIEGYIGALVQSFYEVQLTDYEIAGIKGIVKGDERGAKACC